MADLLSFISRWKASGASERANYQLFLSQLSEQVLEIAGPDPASDQTSENEYTFERRVSLPEGSAGFIDLYKRDCFVLEAKQGSDQHEKSEAELLGLTTPQRKAGVAKRGTRSWERAMQNAKEQARRYARALPTSEGWPPFLIVVDVGHCIDLYADFSRQGKTYVQFPDAQSYRISMDDLQREEIRDLLRSIWTDPLSLDPSRRSAKVTRELAAKLARLAASLEEKGHDPERAAHFLMRCLFSMFSEDVGLLPERTFTGVLTDYRDQVELLPDALEHVWSTMDAGGFSAALKAKIPQFNGDLFRNPEALPLSSAQTELLIQAAKADWTEVEPAIFGTLLERALDPIERHKLGAHFTPRAYVERLVMPTVIEPLRDEWTAVQTAATALEAGEKIKDAREEIRRFHKRLCTIRILDPACGSGNFLYVTLEHLKRLEGEVVKALASYGEAQTVLGATEGVHEMTEGFTVTPGQLLGLEINPRAAAIAEVVLWIGYIQWHIRTYGDPSTLHAPILRRYHNIEHRDALIEYDEKKPRLDEDGSAMSRWDGKSTKPHPATGEPVPDESQRVPIYEYLNPKRAEWPPAEFILGNPPFLGVRVIRSVLGDLYVDTLRATYSDVPETADYVMYWWHKAAELLMSGRIERFGFITTNSVVQSYSRKVLEQHLGKEDGVRLAFAVKDHPWVEASDGAAVRVSMTVAVRETRGDDHSVIGRMAELDGRMEFTSETVAWIDSNLEAKSVSYEPVSLKANEGMCYQGIVPSGSGFKLTSADVERLGYSRDDLPPVIKPYLIGRDLVQKWQEKYIIDFYGYSEDEAASQWPKLYQHLRDTVYPARRQNKRKSYRELWWIFAEPRPTLRGALEGLSRFIATPYTAKHRPFIFVAASYLPDAMVYSVASDDPFVLGVLSSRFHVAWSNRAGGTLEDRPRYNSKATFQPFPFPNADEEEKNAIREAAIRLDEHRKARLNEDSNLTLTSIYNIYDKVRADETLSDAEKAVYEAGLVGILQKLHNEVDNAVAASYGWSVDISDTDAFNQLAILNHERAKQEDVGLIHYLRPEYQAPKGMQVELATEGGEISKEAVEKQKKKRWPSDLPSRVRLVQQELTASKTPLDLKEINRRFSGGRNRQDQVANLLKTLEVLGHVRQTEDGSYVT